MTSLVHTWEHFDTVVQASQSSLERARGLVGCVEALGDLSRQFADAFGAVLAHAHAAHDNNDGHGVPKLGKADEVVGAVLGKLDDLAHTYTQLADDLESSVVNPAAAALDAIAADHAVVVAKATKMQAEFEKHKRKVNESKRRVRVGMGQAGAKATWVERMGGAGMGKGEKAARAVLATDVAAANTAQHEWYTTHMREALQGLEAVSLRQASTTVSALQGMLGALDRQPARARSVCDEMHALVSAVSPQTHLHSFVSAHASVHKGPVLFTVSVEDEREAAGEGEGEGEAQRLPLDLPDTERRDAAGGSGHTARVVFLRVRDTVRVYSDDRLQGVSLVGGQRVGVVVPDDVPNIHLLSPADIADALHMSESDAKAFRDSGVVSVVPHYQALIQGTCARVPAPVLQWEDGDHTVFGVPLPTLRRRDSERFGRAFPLPAVVMVLAQRLLECGADKAEGLFRVPGNKQTIDYWTDKLNEGADEIHTEEVHVCGSLLKKWIREIPGGLVPRSVVDAVANDLKTAPQDKRALVVEHAVNKVYEASTEHGDLVVFVTRLLQHFAHVDVCAHTLMDAANLAMVFSRCVFGDDPPEQSRLRLEQQFVLWLIECLPKHRWGDSDPVAMLRAFPLTSVRWVSTALVDADAMSEVSSMGVPDEAAYDDLE